MHNCRQADISFGEHGGEISALSRAESRFYLALVPISAETESNRRRGDAQTEIARLHAPRRAEKRARSEAHALSRRAHACLSRAPRFYLHWSVRFSRKRTLVAAVITIKIFRGSTRRQSTYRHRARAYRKKSNRKRAPSAHRVMTNCTGASREKRENSEYFETWHWMALESRDSIAARKIPIAG